MVVLLPFMLLSLFMKMQQFLFVSIIVGPALAFTWRARRYLADASAVQLTRNPDGVLGGLLRLSRDGGLIPGTQWAAHLFVVAGEVRDARLQRALQQEMADLREQSGASSAMGQVRASWGPAQAAALRYSAQAAAGSKGTLSDTHAVWVSFHPPLAKRIERLYAMGATRTGAEVRVRPWWQLGGIVFVAPLMVLCGVLLAIALGLVFMLALFANLIVIAIVLIPIAVSLGAKV